MPTYKVVVTFTDGKKEIIRDLTGHNSENGLWIYRQADGSRGIIPYAVIRRMEFSKELDLIILKNQKNATTQTPKE